MASQDDEQSILREIRDAAAKFHAYIEERDKKQLEYLNAEQERQKKVIAWQPFWHLMAGLFVGGLWFIAAALWMLRK